MYYYNEWSLRLTSSEAVIHPEGIVQVIDYLENKCFKYQKNA